MAHGSSASLLVRAQQPPQRQGAHRRRPTLTPSGVPRAPEARVHGETRSDRQSARADRREELAWSVA
jgi:hypothetical protein